MENWKPGFPAHVGHKTSVLPISASVSSPENEWWATSSLGPFCPTASVNLVFEPYPTMDNPGKVLSFVAAVEVLHVTGTSCHLMLGPLKRPVSNSTVSSRRVIQMAKRLCHPPVLSRETLSSERSFHFPWACDSVVCPWSKSCTPLGQPEGETTEASAPAACPPSWPPRGLSAWRQAAAESSPSVNFRPDSNACGLPCWKNKDWILVCPRLCPWNRWADDWYVSPLGQGYTVEKSSKSIRSR